MRRLIHVLIALGLLSLTGCVTGKSNAGSSAPVLQSITVTPAAPTLAVGSTVQFKATGNYSSGPTQDLTNSVTWSSTTPATATISAGGLAMSVAWGTTTVKA